jgi:hypothetical protein
MSSQNLRANKKTFVRPEISANYFMKTKSFSHDNFVENFSPSWQKLSGLSSAKFAF